jgi:hypothetical protein
MKVVALADSDSYLKWAASFLATVPHHWQRELILVSTTVLPTLGQRASALADSGISAAALAPLELPALESRLDQERPDVVLVATRGPVARVLLRSLASPGPSGRRPVLVSGLPGISIPATRKALVFRHQADLFVVHSRRELLEFAELSRELGMSHRFALDTLPFAQPSRPTSGTDLVFAAQAIVPEQRSERMRVARLLIDAALSDPSRRVVVKVRGLAGEHQTHAERDGYPELLDELRSSGVRVPANLIVSAEPMSVALDRAEGLVTVSSTAAIEAIARRVPVIALDTFGVSDELINTVFVGSALFGGEAAVIGREFRHPDPDWLDANYFHDPVADDSAARIAELVAINLRGELPPRQPDRRIGGRLRLAWDRRRAFGRADRSVVGLVALVVGMPARAVVLTGRRMRRRPVAVE